MKAFRNLSYIVLAALILPAAVKAEDMAAVEAQIKAKCAQITGFKAKQREMMEVSNPLVSMKSRGEGTVEFLRKDGKLYARTELRSKMTRTIDNKPQDSEQRTLMILDGSFTHTLIEAGDTKRASKTDLDPQYTGLADDYLAHLKRSNTLALAGEETIGGKKAWVIDAKPTRTPPPGPSTPVITKVYVEKDSGLLLKHEAINADGKPVSTTEYTDHQLGVHIEAERFIFKAPPGVNVMDRSGPAPQAAPPATRPTAPATTKPANP